MIQMCQEECIHLRNTSISLPNDGHDDDYSLGHLQLQVVSVVMLQRFDPLTD
jgi:hypothetical protein